MAPLVSVLVTVYNRESYLSETLRSILNSSAEDFELILVDDCSTDGCVEIARDFAQIDQRIHVYQNERNLGDYLNRMKAASLARGRYLKYIDSDDLIYPHSLAIMVESMERYPDAAMGLCHSMSEDESPYPWCLTPEEVYRKHFLGRGCLNCGPSGAIIRRDAFESLGGFNEQWKVISDTELWCRLAARWPTVLLPPGLVWWRRHDGQQYAAGDAASVYLTRGYEMAMEALSNPDCPLPVPDRENAVERCRQHFSRRLLSLALRRKQPVTALNLYRGSDLTWSDLFHGFRPYR